MPFKKILILISLLVFPLLLFSQDSKALKYAETITKDDLYSYLSVLASDSLEGRETARPGQKKAAEFIKYHFQEFGLQPVIDGDYFQHFELVETTTGRMIIAKDNELFEAGKDFLMLGSLNLIEEERELIFAGEGTEEELKSLDIKGKAVVYFYSSNADFSDKAQLALDLGANVSFGIGRNSRSEFKSFRTMFEGYFNQPTMDFKKNSSDTEYLRVFTHREFVALLFGVQPEQLSEYQDHKLLGKSVQLTITMETVANILTTENVLGFVEGGDKKEELIVITAHYDHEGIIDGKIYNGADDDASGTSAIMELAQAFALAASEGNGPRRSMLFMAVTGEEKGLFGSEYYSDHPVFPLENTVTNLNIDMIGRQDKKHKDNPDYVYLIGTKMLSDELHELSEEVNRTYSKLELDYTYNDKNDPNRFYYRSDHYNFAKHDIPVIFYFNGTHKDYHQPTDTVEKINFRKLQKITKYVFYTAWELANRENRVALNEK